MAWSILRCDEVDSTNNVCKTLAAQGADDMAVIARRQTAGKGRLGRSFLSPEGGLYLSVLWRGCPAEQVLTVTPMAAVAVCRAIEQTCGAVCGIKWCNDVVLDGKKLCGILTESSLRPDGGAEWLVVGIGVNVAQTAFPPDIADIAASLAMQGYSVSPDALAEVLLEQLTAMRQALPHPQAWREEYRRRCVNLGRPVQVLRGETAYVGVIGSRKKTAFVNQRLREAGIPEEKIAFVHTPVGTPIKAVTPEEIAVSIAGEMICVRAARREAAGEVHHGCPMH